MFLDCSNVFFLFHFPVLSSRISYCTADKTQDKVFAYVSQSQFNETLECHAFLCQKRKIVSVQILQPPVYTNSNVDGFHQQATGY